MSLEWPCWEVAEPLGDRAWGWSVLKTVLQEELGAPAPASHSSSPADHKTGDLAPHTILPSCTAASLETQNIIHQNFQSPGSE